MQFLYRVTLSNGVERLVTRKETPDKNIIGLWIWSQRPENKDKVVMLDFNECVINSNHVMMIDRPELLEEEQDVHTKAVVEEGTPYFLVGKEGTVNENDMD